MKLLDKQYNEIKRNKKNLSNNLFSLFLFWKSFNFIEILTHFIGIVMQYFS